MYIECDWSLLYQIKQMKNYFKNQQNLMPADSHTYYVLGYWWMITKHQIVSKQNSH